MKESDGPLFRGNFRGHWYSDLWMACAVKIAFSDSGSWEACEHAPVEGQSPLVFAVEGLGESELEVLLRVLPSRRFFTRAGRSGHVKGSIKASKSAASLGKYVAGIEERNRVNRSMIFQLLYAEDIASASTGAAPGTPGFCRSAPRRPTQDKPERSRGVGGIIARRAVAHQDYRARQNGQVGTNHYHAYVLRPLFRVAFDWLAVSSGPLVIA